MKRVAEALGVSRPHLSATSSGEGNARAQYSPEADADVLGRVRTIIDERASYGYRRVTAKLNAQRGAIRLNHKRIYRVMKRAGVLLAKQRNLTT